MAHGPTYCMIKCEKETHSCTMPPLQAGHRLIPIRNILRHTSHRPSHTATRQLISHWAATSLCCSDEHAQRLTVASTFSEPLARIRAFQRSSYVSANLSLPISALQCSLFVYSAPDQPKKTTQYGRYHRRLCEKVNWHSNFWSIMRCLHAAHLQYAAWTSLEPFLLTDNLSDATSATNGTYFSRKIL